MHDVHRSLAQRTVAPATVLCAIAAGAVSLAAAQSAAPPAVSAGMVRIPAGSYLPLYREPTPPRLPRARTDREEPARPATAPAARQFVASFDIDVHPVTNAEYLAFVRAHPEWRRSQAKRLFVEPSYLAHWAGDLALGPMAPPDSPVVNVSWFAARAYLRTQGKDLPTVDEWEYVAAASERARDASRDAAFIDRLRAWYGQPVPQPMPSTAIGFRNAYGVRGLHGLVWEWTLDFNSALVTGESRGDTTLERSLYCGAGASAAADFENYPAFMRYALRSSLQARYAVASLGFRGVRHVDGDHP